MNALKTSNRSETAAISSDALVGLGITIAALGLLGRITGLGGANEGRAERGDIVAWVWRRFRRCRYRHRGIRARPETSLARAQLSGLAGVIRSKAHGLLLSIMTTTVRILLTCRSPLSAGGPGVREKSKAACPFH